MDTQTPSPGEPSAHRRSGGSVIGRIATVSAVVTLCAYAALSFVPAIYESTAQVLLTPIAGDAAAPDFVREGQIVVSTRVIEAAVAGLDTPVQLALAPYVARPDGLGAILVVGHDAEKGLLSITARLGRGALAADFANAVADSYVALRPELLETPAADLQAMVLEPAPAVDESAAASPEIAAINEQIAAARARNAELQGRASYLAELVDTGNLQAAAPEFQQSLFLQRLIGEKAELDGERAQLAATLLGNHPTLRTLDARIAALETQLRQQAAQVVAAVQAEADAEKRTEAALLLEIEAATTVVAPAPATETQVAAPEPVVAAFAARKVRIADIPAMPAFPPVIPTLIIVALGTTLLQLLLLVLARRRAKPMPLPLADHAEPPQQDIEPVFETALHPIEPAIAEAAEIGEPEMDTVAEIAADLAAEELQEIETEPETAPDDTFDELLAGLPAGEGCVIAVTSTGTPEDCDALALRIAWRLHEAGRNVVLVDAGSRQAGSLPGITDLAIGEASYGEVVQAHAEGIAEVPWGTLATFESRSDRSGILIDALQQLYDTVVISCGAMRTGSALPVFASVTTRLLIQSADGRLTSQAMDDMVEDALRLGFEDIAMIEATERRAA